VAVVIGRRRRAVGATAEVVELGRKVLVLHPEMVCLIFEIGGRSREYRVSAYIILPCSDTLPQAPDSRIIALFQPPKLPFYSLQAITERLERARYLTILGIRFKLE
jgi:hypothetical protein